MANTRQGRRRRYSAEEIERWLGEQNREGLTYQKLSERSGIPVPTLASWRRKARMLEGDSPGLVELHVENGQGRCDRDAIAPMGNHQPMVVVVLANGRRIEVEGGFEDAALVARLATMLERPC